MKRFHFHAIYLQKHDAAKRNDHIKWIMLHSIKYPLDMSLYSILIESLVPEKIPPLPLSSVSFWIPLVYSSWPLTYKTKPDLKRFALNSCKLAASWRSVVLAPSALVRRISTPHTSYLSCCDIWHFINPKLRSYGHMKKGYMTGVLKSCPI